MKKALLLTIFLMIGSVCWAQQWTQNADFTGGDRSGVHYFKLQNQPYLMGGYVETGGIYEAYSMLWKYDITTDKWTEVSDYPGGNLYGGFAFVIGETAYIGLGADENGSHNNEVWSYNPTAGWQQAANFPGNLRVFPFSFQADGKGYIGAGFSSSASLLNDLWEYDPTTNKWTKKANYPGGGRIGLVAFGIDDKGYVGLGDNNITYFDDLHEYDPTTNMWTTKQPFQGSNRSFCGATVVGSSGYLLGGESLSGNMTNEMWGYNAATNQWTQEETFTGTARRHGALYHVNSTFYYGLGQFGFNDNQMLTDFWEFESDIISTNDTYAKEVNIYPVPFTNVLTISIPYTNNYTITVYNSTMQEIYTGTETSINTIDWEAGIYFVQVNTSAGIITRKVIK